MKYRKLRIAWSVFWGVGCLLLVVLWARSRHISEAAVLQGSSQYLGVSSEVSRLQIGWVSGTLPQSGVTSAAIDPSTVRALDRAYLETVGKLGFGIQFGTIHMGFTTPHWFQTLLFAALGVVPWIRWRFTLRTMLIATTLVAVVLGLALWAART